MATSSFWKTVLSHSSRVSASSSGSPTNDPGTGVMRHVDAGYEEAIECAQERGVNIPML